VATSATAAQRAKRQSDTARREASAGSGSKLDGPAARLARALEWHRQLDAGEVASRAEIARWQGISRARVTQILASLAGHVVRRAAST